MPDVHFWTLTELASQIAAREVCPVDVVERMLDRIDHVDARLGAYVTVTADFARRGAEQARRHLASGRRPGLLQGVPIAIKDLCDTQGIQTSAGMAIFSGRIPDKNATAVQRLLDAGAVLLGKLKTTEGAGILHHPSIAPPVNPWNAERWCGASSSGSGVATAAGLCFGSIGTDTAGSIRFPSASNGIVGLKPTFGRVPADGVFPLAPSLDHVGPMTRSVRDAARMFAVLSAASEASPASPDGPRGFEVGLDRGVQGLKIGLDEAYCCREVDSVLADAVLAAARHLETLGAEVHPIQVRGIDEALAAFGVLFHTEVAAVHAPYHANHRSEYGPHLSGIVEVGERLTESDRAAAREVRKRFASELERLLGTVDAMICPPAMSAPPPVDIMSYTPTDFREMAMALRYTAPYDLAGVPTLTLPCGFAEGSVPLGLQLVAGPFQEERLLRIGQAYEETTDWHLRHPALGAG